MSREWTPQQNSAITSTGGTILVSAAAGSGKTAVLVERVIRMITDPEHPVDADRLLVVTFTRDAAAEMKQRIAKALSDLLEKDPFNQRLLRQSRLLYTASISTIDSIPVGTSRFCLIVMLATWSESSNSSNSLSVRVCFPDIVSLTPTTIKRSNTTSII